MRWNDDSMDTMDMYRLFENKDIGKASEAELTNNLSEKERAKWVKNRLHFKYYYAHQVLLTANIHIFI